MINILSYLGMNVQSEVCLWTLLGLLRTIFDATLFRVNANLKQVWQMRMPEELSKPVQRGLRTMISGVMLVQCFTVYVYLATYIVLLYPVFLGAQQECMSMVFKLSLQFLCATRVRNVPKWKFGQEERPALVLPWLLLAAVRNLLCELLSLALGLGTCLLVGPARPPCIKFLLVKVISIMPAFYMWLLILSYYHALKMATMFKTFPVAAHEHDRLDYGLELAIRRRRTKSLFGESLLRTRLISNVYIDKQMSAVAKNVMIRKPFESPAGLLSGQTSSITSNKVEQTDVEPIDFTMDVYGVMQASSNKLASFDYDDGYSHEISLPRNADRVNEQFGLMLLRISEYIKRENVDRLNLIGSHSLVPMSQSQDGNLGPTLNEDPTDTPPLVASSKGVMASYLRDYPQIFRKKPSDLQVQQKLNSIRAVQSQIGGIDYISTERRQIITLETGKMVGSDNNSIQKKITIDKTHTVMKQKISNDSNATKQSELLKYETETQDTKLIDKCSSDSLSSIIARMKTHLSDLKSKKLNLESGTSSPLPGSPPTSSSDQENKRQTERAATCQ